MEKISIKVRVNMQCPYCGFCGTMKAYTTQNKKPCPVCNELIFLRYATGVRGELDEHGYYYHATEPYNIEEINKEYAEMFEEQPKKQAFTIRQKDRKQEI